MGLIFLKLCPWLHGDWLKSR